MDRTILHIFFIQFTVMLLFLAVHQLADGVAESLNALEHILVADV